MTVFHRVTEGKLGSHDGCTIEDEVSQEFLDRIPGGLFRYRADDEGGTIDYVSRDVLELFGLRHLRRVLLHYGQQLHRHGAPERSSAGHRGDNLSNQVWQH